MKILPDFRKRWKVTLAAVLIIAAVLVLLPLILYTPPSLPPGTSVASSPVNVAPENIRLLIDDTAWDAGAGRRVMDQEIFDEILAMIGRADQFIYVDLFLWNPWQGAVPEDHRRLSRELADAIIRKKREARQMDVIVLTDPINRIYGSQEPELFKDMAKAGIPVVFTDLSRLPDSNRIYAPYWSLLEKLLRTRLFSRWASRPLFQNPFDREGEDVSLLQLGRMLMFKANHRKVVITGSTGHGLEMLVGSLNPADGSSAHSNLALLVRGRPVLEALKKELEAFRWSIEKKRNVIVGATSMASYKADSVERKAVRMAAPPSDVPEGLTVQWLTEGAIAETVIGLLEGAGEGDEIRLAMFYLSERGAIEALKEAVKRGAVTRIVLDANRDAFGMRKIGVPNRPVAAELMELSADHDIQIRWADTHGEQFHTKALSITGRTSRKEVLLAGSANWTRRNIGGLNMEADLLVRNAPVTVGRFNAWFDGIWDNGDGLSHTLPYGEWQEKGLKRFVKTRIYRFQERYGAGTF